MTSFVQRTNPDRRTSGGKVRWVCAVCRTSYKDKDDATACAGNDLVTGDRERKQPAIEEPFDLVLPPCTLDVTREVKQ